MRAYFRSSGSIKLGRPVLSIMRALLALAPLSASSCASPTGDAQEPEYADEAESVGAGSSALTDYGPTALWPRFLNAYFIDVCFIQATAPGSSAAPDWNSDKTRVQNVMLETWDAASGVAFAFNGDCPASIPSDWMPIQLQYDSNNPGAFGGHGAPGKGSRQPVARCVNQNCQVEFGYGPNYHEYETVAVHEVGHALGMKHEFTRPDFPGCTSLLDGSFVARDDESNVMPLTQNWDPYSVMAWWDCYENRMHDNFAYYELSEGDKIGINIMYPKSLARTALGASFGFGTTSGRLVRNDGWIITDWAASGAHVLVGSVPVWSIRSGGVFTDIATTYSLHTSSLAFATYDLVRATFTDFWNRTNTVSENVVVNNSVHTAVLKNLVRSL